MVAVVVAAGWLAASLVAGTGHEADPAFTRRSGPLAYRILYRVDVLQDPPSTTFEERLVRRPFEGRILSSTSRDVDLADPGTSGTMSIGSSILSISDGQRMLVQQRVPSAAIGDVALASVLEEAVRLGHAEAQPDGDLVLDRPCRLFAVKEPGARVLAAPTESSRTTVCIDDDGLILREQWELRGRVVLERTAIEFEEDPDLTALGNPSNASTPDAALRMGATVRAVDRVDSFIEEPSLPRGWTLTGRFETVTVDQTRGLSRTTAWVMQDNADFLVVEAGDGRVNLSGRVSEVPSALGEGALFFGTMGAEIRVLVDATRWIRVTTSAPPTDLSRYVETLRTRD